uniref:non-specific serine/threonine protein kinase n=1 Tax=uncultured Chloroflexota bacterium TaxID=166587 RepID=H5SPE1_9CHLR|nr:protein kinase [uncultured Chloroflexota bacterium]
MSLGTQHLSPHDSSQGSGKFDEQILPKGAILEHRYEIHKVLGVGGMGAVYLAQDLRFTGAIRMCAVKEMISTTPDPQVRRLAVQTFEREATLLVQLNHPGIPEIYDFFTEGIRSYLVMEYVEGEDLEHILDNTEGMLKEETVLDWAIQVCDILVYLHSQNPPIVFRDMKPSNIMLRKRDGKIALIDFGIAKAFEGGQKGTMIGTEGYSPPEQYKGIADPRGDIYALGATLHHLLTKRDPRLEPPFSFHQEPVRLLNPAVSEETNAVIMKALEYEPAKRYPSAQAFKEALQAALQKKQSGSVAASAAATQVLPESSPAAQPSPPPPYPPQQGYPPYPPPQQPYPYPPYPGPYPPPYPPQQPPGPTGWQQPVTEVEEIEDSILPIWKFKCEDEIRGKAPTADKKNLYVGAYDNNLYALDLKTGKFQWKYPTEGGIAVKPALYKDRLIFGSEDRVVYAISTSGRLIWTCPTEGRVRSSAVVEFDHAFFGSDDYRLYAVNAQTGRVIWRYETMGPVRSSPTLGDELVYVGSEDGHLHAVDLSTGAARWKFRANRNITSSPTLYQDLIIVGSSDWNVYGIEAKTGYPAWRFRTNNAVISSPVVFDGIVYVGSTDRHLYAIDVKNGRLYWKFEAGGQVVSTPAVTEEAIYFGTSAGEVISLSRKDKKIRWKFKTNGPVTSSPLVYNGVVYIGSTDHYVYALPV